MLRRALGLASIAAGAAHGGLAPRHFSEWWGYGVFFTLASLAQIVYGLALLTRALGEDARRERGLLLAGAAGNALLIGLYAYSRLVGVPLLGPSAGEIEPFDLLGLATKLLEAFVLAGSLVLAARLADGARHAEPA